EAQRGDLCFLKLTILGLHLNTKSHVVLFADGPTTESGAKIFGHENNRCGEFVPFNKGACVYYHIEETTWDGKWKSTDANSRFSLSIDGKSVQWTENQPPQAVGPMFTVSVQMKSKPGDNLF